MYEFPIGSSSQVRVLGGEGVGEREKGPSVGEGSWEGLGRS